LCGLLVRPRCHGAAGLERRPSVERLDSKAASDQVPFALAPDFLKSKPGIISLIPGAAVAGYPRQRRAQHARAKSEASLACEHDGAKEEPKTKGARGQTS
jgi:hypothetical protein